MIEKRGISVVIKLDFARFVVVLNEGVRGRSAEYHLALPNVIHDVLHERRRAELFGLGRYSNLRTNRSLIWVRFNKD